MARAEENFSNCKYKSALNLYIKLLKIDQNNTSVNFKAGLCCFNLPNSNENAIGYLKRACMSKDTLPEAFFYLGSIYQLEERFDEALQTFNHFLNFVKSNKNGRELRSEVLLRIHMCLAAGDLLKKNISVEFKNFKEVNSAYDDCAANWDKSTKSVFFSSKRKGNIGGFMDEDGSFFDDIYTLIPNSTNPESPWSKAKKAPSKLNSEFSDRILSFSSDGNTMLIARDGDIYTSMFIKKNWTTPIKLNSQINSKLDENSACFSKDGTVLYFSSNRKGGFGGMDLYKSEKTLSDEWGPAINLGKTINTAYDEDYPFYHENSKTLYFSSKREECIGGFDVFKSKLSLNEWDTPENMGAPLNTTADDIFFSLDDSGSHGFYSSARKGGNGNLDVYELFFPEKTNDTAELEEFSENFKMGNK